MDNVSITGIAAVNANLQKLTQHMQNVNENTVKTAAFDLEAQTKTQITANKSVITGTLRRSVNAEPINPLLWRVGTNVEYGPCVEARKPYLQPSLDVIAARFPQLVTENLRSVI
jgi:hypothetical protein